MLTSIFSCNRQGETTMSLSLRSVVNFIAATLVKIISSVVIIKFLAWQLGPNGFGLISQLMALAAIASMLAGGGITNGVIKTLSASSSDTDEGRAWIGNALFITCLFSVMIAAALLIGAPLLASNILEGKFVGAVICLAITQALAGLGSLILAESSSRGDSASFAVINACAALLGAVAIATGVYLNGADGAAYAIALAPAFTGVLGLLLLMRKRRLVVLSAPCFDWRKVKGLMSFSSLTLVGALSVPLAQIFIRESMGAAFSWEAVGYWQGAVKISDVYMQFVGVILINYALPRFSNSDVARALAECRSALIGLFGLLISGFALLLVFQDFAITLVFSSEFLPMRAYFLPQMCGDLFRTVAATASFFLLARGHIKVPLVFEVLQGALMYGVYMLLQKSEGLMAPVYAHLLTYALLSCLMGWCVKRYLRTARQ